MPIDGVCRTRLQGVVDGLCRIVGLRQPCPEFLIVVTRQVSCRLTQEFVKQQGVLDCRALRVFARGWTYCGAGYLQRFESSIYPDHRLCHGLHRSNLDQWGQVCIRVRYDKSCHVAPESGVFSAGACLHHDLQCSTVIGRPFDPTGDRRCGRAPVSSVMTMNVDRTVRLSNSSSQRQSGVLRNTVIPNGNVDVANARVLREVELRHGSVDSDNGVHSQFFQCFKCLFSVWFTAAQNSI